MTEFNKSVFLTSLTEKIEQDWKSKSLKKTGLQTSAQTAQITKRFLTTSTARPCSSKSSGKFTKAFEERNTRAERGLITFPF